MNETTALLPVGLVPQPRPSGENDAVFMELRLSLKVSSHTRRAYAADLERFLAFVRKPLGWITLSDVQSYVGGHLGAGKPKTGQPEPCSYGNQILILLRAGDWLLPIQRRRCRQVAAEPRQPRAAHPGRERSRQTHRVSPGGPQSRAVEAALCIRHPRQRTLRPKWCDAVPRAEGGQITVFGKRGRTRTILLKPKPWTQLLSIRGDAGPVDAIFRSRKGGHLEISQVRRIVYAAAKKAGLEQKVSPHWMRHAHASHALDRSAPIHLVQATLGHSSISTTGRYLDARPTESTLTEPRAERPQPLQGCGLTKIPDVVSG